ncbi:MAG TPA: flagellar biosynthesis anti-sigma factor FlgM [Spirochaetes bacterium]|nr:flagellar biosynthesis anti-sigma factor FlgM [Spirochaetota bacterium]
MVIDKIGNINNIVESKNAKSVSKAKETKKADSVQISTEAKMAAETARYSQIIKDTPDIRMDRVREIKSRILDGTYDKFNDDKVLEMVADKIARHLLRK